MSGSGPVSAPATTPADHQLAHRPLVGGIRILNADAGEFGTLGCFARRGSEELLLSCRHVLYPWEDGPVAPAQLKVYQPQNGSPADMIAEGVELPAVPLDCAAARLVTAVSAGGEILGIGLLAGTRPPEDGLLVCKSGSASGVTHGTLRLLGGRWVVLRAPGAPPGSLLSDNQDSGAVWVAEEDRRAVLLHVGMTLVGRHRAATGVAIDDALAALGLALWV